MPVWADDVFEKNIRPLLADQCIKCHGPTKQAGGLRLDSRDALLKGGDSGPAAVSGKPNESLLIKAVAYTDELRMPPKARLADGDIANLRDWVNRGLPWPATKTEVAAKGPGPLVTDEHRRWWAYQPLRPVVPPRPADDHWSRTEIDRFIQAGLRANGMQPAAPTDKRTLLRRATFDLVGLPPSPQEVDAFLKDDRADAFERAVDRLLASPHYGERWGRHWLDVARYADSYQKNPLEHPSNANFELHEAYRYRDWVVSAFNRDLPYDEFVRRQIAGDLLPGPKGESPFVDGLTATGFLCIGSVDHFDADKNKIVSDLVDDQIDAVGKAFLGLTVSCARCHDHKFDPISTKDYYALAGMFYSTRVLSSLGAPGDTTAFNRVPLVPAPVLAERKRHETRLAELAALLEDGDRLHRVRQLRAGGVAAVPSKVTSAAGAAATHDEGGVITVAGSTAKDTYTVDVVLAKGVTVKAVRLEALADPKLPAGGPGRASNGNFVVNKFTATFTAAKSADAPKPLTFAKAQADFEQVGFPVGSSIAGTPNQGWAIHPKGGTDHVAVYELAEEFTLPQDGTLSFTLTQRHAEAHTLGRFRLALLATVPAMSPDTGAERQQRVAERDTIQKLLSVPVPKTLAVQEGGTPGSLFPAVQDVKLHVRGSYARLGPVVKRQLPQFLAGASQPELTGSGRRELARWIASPENPLTARVMVNRVWQHHFGEGIVRTPSNFGKLGDPPSHPELLDWLAAQFIQDGWSVKKLHRRIMLSAAYRQAASAPKETAAKDPDNRLFGRMSPRRLEAEAIRDALLVAAGRLDPTVGGPAVLDLNTPRRSLYVASPRWDQSNFATLFDAANPSQSVERRSPSTVAPQALFLLNNPFALAQAKHLAARLKAAAADDPSRIRLAYALLFSRPPAADELRAGSRFLAAADWDDYAHALLCGNEFLYID